MIQKEDINGDEATVTAKITVYDLYKVGKEADEYLSDNPNEFAEGNTYDEDAFMNTSLIK